MKVLISSVLRSLSSSLKSDLKKSDGVGKIVVFLGGECPEGNEWRTELKKEFKDRLFFLDPYDESWEAEENIYTELEGLVRADHVVFYRGGAGTVKEKKFLDGVGEDGYKSFSDLDKLKEYLRGLSESKKEASLVSVRSILSSMSKKSYPWSNSLDLKFERIDGHTLQSLVKDIEEGQSIKVDPEVKKLRGLENLRGYSGKEILEDEGSRSLLEVVYNKPLKFSVPHPDIYYDKTDHTIKPIPGGSISIETAPNLPMVKKAKKGQTYDFSSTQVDLPQELSERIISWGKNLPEDEIYTEEDGDHGREDEIHTTVLYGLIDESPDGVASVLEGVKPFKVSLGKITAFLTNDKYDVLKIDVDSPEMVKLHYALEDKLPNENTFPIYKPHVTIAYLKKGEAEKYIGRTDFKGEKFKAREILFSSKNGDKIPLGMEIPS